MFFIPILSAILFLLCSLFSFLLFQDDSIVRSFLCPSSFALFPSPCPLASLLSSFSGRLNRPLFPSPPFAARPLHPPRLADRAAPPFLSFHPENLIILTFPSPKICIYHFFVLSLRQISGFLSPTNPLIH